MDRSNISETLMEPDEEFLRRLDELMIRCECGYTGPRCGHLNENGVVGCMVWCNICEKAFKRTEYEAHQQPCRSTLDIQPWFPQLRFGMSPTEVTRQILQNPHDSTYRSFQDLPQASEIQNFECRYLYHDIATISHLLTPDLVQLIPPRAYNPYLVFMFHEVEGLCMISIRTVDHTFTERFIRMFDIPRDPTGYCIARDEAMQGLIVWVGRCGWDSTLVNVEFVDKRCIAENGHDYVKEIVVRRDLTVFWIYTGLYLVSFLVFLFVCVGAGGEDDAVSRVCFRGYW
ncbi:hypothetical protein HDU76_001772 [Blyttiomyces sp. JEL0837]|nr:hypothetical protein HDU76_001772 [Blyttiomyces sp. JEL0837]